MIEQIRDTNGTLLAVVIGADYRERGVSFVTENHVTLQMAYMNWPAGHEIAAHVHNPIPRMVTHSLEALVIKSGLLRADFYSGDQAYIESRLLGAGSAVLLISGGHGFYVIEDAEFFEVKQGPYVGERDKERFELKADVWARYNPKESDQDGSL